MLAQRGILFFLKTEKQKINISQSKYTNFCLNLDKIACISQKEFEAINCKSIKERFNQCINFIALNTLISKAPIISMKFCKITRI